MFWIVQEDVYAKNQRYDLIEVLSRLEIPFTTVKVHKNNIEPNIEIDNKSLIITNGSIMLSNIAKNKGWNPGSLFNDNFSYEVWSKYYNDLLINKNAIVSTLEEAKPISDKVFVRPILDNKSFNGKVYTREEFLKFQKDSLNFKVGSPKPDIKILMSLPKSIGQEHRHYIVDSKVVTSSRYKLGGVANFKEGCDESILNVVNDAIGRWQPAQAFVLDTYVSGEDIGIVEIGCICHAGIYDSDIMRLVIALDSMENTLVKKNKYTF